MNMSESNLIDEVYKIFEKYPNATDFCEYCNTKEHIEYFIKTPLRDIDIENSKLLLNESGDHWESTDVYKRFLPRLLEIIGPPYNVELMYPKHLFENMILFHDFNTWSEHERDIVIKYLSSIEKSFKSFDEDDWKEWNEEFDKFKNA